MKRLPFFCLLFFSVSILFAQNDPDAAPGEKQKKEKNLSIIPLPVIAYNPTTAWMLGVAPGVSWFMGDPSTTSISSGLGSFIYTTNKQWIFTAKTNVFLEGDSWNLMGDWRFFITSQPTYGLGTGPQSAKPVGTGIEYE
jgi:hypothetical protein